MGTSRFTALIYYSLATLTSSVLVIGFLLLIDWPLMAAIPIGIVSFVYLVVFSRYLYNNWEGIKSVVMDGATDHVGSSLFKNQYSSSEENHLS